jgi:hypothetical protein
MAKSPKELDRLAWKQRIEEVEKVRKRIRRKEWMYNHFGDAVLIVLLALVLISVIALTLGG